jgi:hypothetical protein
MTPATLLRHRLHNQRLAASPFDDPADLVRWMGAVQAQDYAGALWAIGLRTRNATERMIERAIANRAIVRTWPMRGTLHFTAAEDARWMLDLLAPRVVAASTARLEREYGLDQRTLARSREVVARARLAHDGLICYGPREGKQQTLALLDEWIPGGKRPARDEALAELARRYFTSHGPATVNDFAWWSGLLLTDAADGLALATGHLVSFGLADRTYWAAPSAPADDSSRRAYLLPAFDEYTVAYRDRDMLGESAHGRPATGMDILRPAIVVRGRVKGSWTRTIAKHTVTVRLSPFTRLPAPARRAVSAAGRRYAAFLELPAVAS